MISLRVDNNTEAPVIMGVFSEVLGHKPASASMVFRHFHKSEAVSVRQFPAIWRR